jgi:hypothetical protein
MATPKKTAARYDSRKIAAVKSRLSKNALTKEDQAFIKMLLTKTEQDAKGKSVGGRPIVAKLPYGMDIIK